MSEVYIHYSNEGFRVGAYAFSTLEKAQAYPYDSLATQGVVSIEWVQEETDLWVGNVHVTQRSSLYPYGQRFAVWIRRYTVDENDTPPADPSGDSAEERER